MNGDFYGWKGGTYSYGEDTPCHLADFGYSDDEYAVEFDALVGQMVVDYLINNKGE